MGRKVPQLAMDIGKTLRAIRQESGLTMKDVSIVLGVSCQQIQKYETGQNRFPLEKLYFLRKLYNIEYEEFFTALDVRYGIRNQEDKLALMFSKLQDMKDKTRRAKIQRILSILLN